MNSGLQTLLYFLRQNLHYKWLFIGAAGSWLLGMTAQKLAIPLVIAAAIDLLVTIAHGTTQGIDYVSTFLPYITAVIGIGVVSQALIASGLILIAKLETKVRVTMQDDIYKRLLNQSLAFHSNNFGGSIVTQVKRFTSAYTHLTDAFVLFALKMFANVIIAIVVIAFFSWPIALAMLVWTVCFTYLNFILTRRRMRYSKAAAAADSNTTAHLADTIGNVAAVKAFAAEKTEQKVQHEKLRDFAKKKYLTWYKATLNDALFGSLMLFLQVMVLVMSVYAIATDTMTIGILLLIQVYTTQLMAELWGFSGLSRNIEQSLSDAVELTETLNAKVSVSDTQHPQKMHVTKGAVSFNDVSFMHEDAAHALFTHFNLSIAPGEKVGLVGHSGSGKTTLTRLLLRFSDVQSGTICIDGQNIAEVRQSDLRAHIAYVPQEPILFHRTLRENIAYSKPNATDEAVQEAAKQAHAMEFIEKLPEGFETVVGERGVKLSGGQRQRIAIARAILKDAPILVLDEATSALDSESEKLIQDALTKLMKGRTTIVIAHRLSTIQSLDRIIVLDDGKIIEEGSHASLLRKKGAYAELWQHQSGGFIDE